MLGRAENRVPNDLTGVRGASTHVFGSR